MTTDTDKSEFYEFVLNIPMEENDAGASTIRDYLANLMLTLWEEEERFSGKRPFGNSGWMYEIFEAMESTEELKDMPYDELDRIMVETIEYLLLAK